MNSCAQLWLWIGTGVDPLFRFWSKELKGCRFAGLQDCTLNEMAGILCIHWSVRRKS